MSNHTKINLLAYASGIAGADLHCGEGPLVVQQSFHAKPASWEATIFPSTVTELRVDEKVQLMCEALAKKVSEIITRKNFPIVLGGDHTSAIGTWSGVYDALHVQGDLGLIWIDAHMDSHTPETTESGRLHGMPLASLLGYGYPTLTNILHFSPKIKPKNLCLIGVRSFERGEAALLKRLKVRIYDMDEIRTRGLPVVFEEAMQLVCQHTIGYGISLDLDSIDPQEMPGVDVPAPNGLHAAELFAEIIKIMKDPKLFALEIVEFDPSRDIEHKSKTWIINLLEHIIKRRLHDDT